MNEPPLLSPPAKADAEHLKLLAIFHFVLAGLSVVGLGFLVLQWTMMNLFFLSPEMTKNMQGGPPPEFVLTIFKGFLILMGGFSILKTMGNLLSGWYLLQHRARMFSLVMAGINCISFPFGTALGVFTFVVLLRESVSKLYPPKANR